MLMNILIGKTSLITLANIENWNEILAFNLQANVEQLCNSTLKDSEINFRYKITDLKDRI